MKYWKILLSLVLMIGVSDLMLHEADAARRGGASRSSPSRSSPSRSTPSRSAKTPSRSPSSAKRPTSKPAAPKRSAADQKLYDKAKSSGTVYKSKTAATTAFKEKNASQYKSKYDKQPAARPDHIPQSTSVGGTSYNVTYNQTHGGYGYMGPSGSWMMYNTMADVAMVSMLMGRQNYYVDTVPMATGGQVAVVRRGPSAFTIFLIIGGIIVVIVVGGFFLSKVGGI